MAFRFRDYGRLTDGEIELAVRGTRLPTESWWVPSYDFDILLPGRQGAIGRIALRVGQTEYVALYAGHVGYGINRPFRGNRYAAKACNLLKRVALDHDLTTLWITCNPDNIPSRKTCEIIGAEFVEIVDLPEDSDMYRAGERQKCRYRWEIRPEKPGQRRTGPRQPADQPNETPRSERDIARRRIGGVWPGSSGQT